MFVDTLKPYLVYLGRKGACCVESSADAGRREVFARCQQEYISYFFLSVFICLMLLKQQLYCEFIQIKKQKRS